MTVRQLVLWRHGETEHNVVGRLQGHLDSALTSIGRNQARFAVPALARLEPELVITSDLWRAAETASVFAEATGVPLRTDERLRETNLGQWQGLTPEEVEKGWPGRFSQWRADPRFAPPGGESRIQVADRAVSLLRELWPVEFGPAEFGSEDKGTSAEESTIMLATHSGLISSLTGRLLRLPPETWQSLRGPNNCHWVELVWRERQWRLHAYNAGVVS